MADPRFAKISTDPKFRPISRKQKKVQIDKRFQSMFTDKRFTSSVKVDKRGRPVKFTSKENYERFYSLDDSDENSSSSDDDSSAEVESNNQTESTSKSESFSKKKKYKKPLAPEIVEKLHDKTVDYARGEGDLLSESSSEEESSEEEEDEDANQFDKWGELDHDAERGEEVTKRLAMCNMDWDRVGSKDIFIALSSFCPTGGSVLSVRIFVSEFGKARLAEEDRLGPEELRKRDEEAEASEDEDEEIDDDVRKAKKEMERVRRYQVNRLKYYYAVAEFDSPATANKVYEECDGKEYELSSTRFDLRFIPDEMDFDEEPKEVCSSMPDPSKYKPKVFFTTALQQGKVELTWDEVDPQRKAAMQRAFDKAGEDAGDDDLKAYLASSDDDEDKDERVPEVGEGSEEDESDQDAIAKYKALLEDIKHTEEKEKEEKGNMEITWGSSAVSADLKKKELDKMSPWEQYLSKKKEKRKAKKEKSKTKTDDDDEKAFSDDELPGGVDFDDPFFTMAGDDKPAKSKKKDKKKRKKTPEEEDQSLALLVASDDEHFDYKQIVDNETKKKKKKRKMDPSKEVNDDFAMNVKDDRFTAMYKNAHYNVDPSNPNFKKTKSMQAIIEEKQRRILQNDDETVSTKEQHGSTSDLGQLVSSIKKKTKMSSKKNKHKKVKGKK